jgi:polyhydroxyalkanoate synthesis regulator phasin
MNWQDATVAVFGILLVISLGSVLIWQIFKTGQVAISSEAEKKKAAEINQAIADSTAAQQVTAARLAELSEGVQELRTRVAAIEQLLREVE